jgi:hypothetical protein
MDFENWELAAPARLIREIALRYRLVAGLALLAVVEDPHGSQTTRHVEVLPIDCRIARDTQAADLLHEAMQHLPLPDPGDRDTRHSVVTVIVRPGPAKAGRHEDAWASAWRNTNHLRPAFTGNLLLVTEHGWYDLLSAKSSGIPRMQRP